MKKEYTSCTWQNSNQCEECRNKNALNCRWKASDLVLFFMIAMPAMLGTLSGTILIGLCQGVWWPTIVYILFFPIILGVFETRFLCSHCPFYAEDGKVLHCIANHGLFKIWRYHPEPMNRFEKILMIILAIVFVILLPGSILGYDIWYFAISPLYNNITLFTVVSLTVVVAMSLIGMVFIMAKSVCSKCVNFSCPFNMVKKSIRDDYLRKNPVMLKAWEDKGYKLGESEDKKT